jgi:hypothetical protein
LSCINKPIDNPRVYSDTTQHSESLATKTRSSDAEIIETFLDSTNIGEKGNCKIEIIKYRIYKDAYVIVKFYTKEANGWLNQNTYLYKSTFLEGLDPKISDFNNDKLNDITFISLDAARGANEVRRLFIYDKQKKELTSIVNSESYPNMLYNDELDCIDAFLVYGGCSTVFLKIEGDSLKEFAKVDNYDNYRKVYEIDKLGNEKLIKKEPLDTGDIYARYKNFKPLEEYKD